jgi:hypothetical protein
LRTAPAAAAAETFAEPFSERRAARSCSVRPQSRDGGPGEGVPAAQRPAARRRARSSRGVAALGAAAEALVLHAFGERAARRTAAAAATFGLSLVVVVASIARPPNRREKRRGEGRGERSVKIAVAIETPLAEWPLSFTCCLRRFRFGYGYGR